MPDEKCTCTHGGVENEDHTVGNGCERRGCTCRYWPIEFESTNTRTEITKWYSITGARPMEFKTVRGVKRLMPYSAKFVFVEGEPLSLSVAGKVVRQDGSVSDTQIQQVPEIYMWNQEEWPAWLHSLYQLACADLARESLLASA